jgi:hypothetical protein
LLTLTVDDSDEAISELRERRDIDRGLDAKPMDEWLGSKTICALHRNL